MRIEFLLAFLQNVKVACSIVALVSGFGAFIALGPIGSDCPKGSDDQRLAFKWGFRLLGIFVLTGLIALTPSIDDVWKVRVALIKFELASPENIKSGAEVIERIGHKLECKYLGGKGCDETKKQIPEY